MDFDSFKQNIISISIHYYVSVRTPMHLAAEKGHTSTVEFLAGAPSITCPCLLKQTKMIYQMSQINSEPRSLIVQKMEVL